MAVKLCSGSGESDFVLPFRLLYGAEKPALKLAIYVTWPYAFQRSGFSECNPRSASTPITLKSRGSVAGASFCASAGNAKSAQLKKSAPVESFAIIGRLVVAEGGARGERA